MRFNICKSTLDVVRRNGAVRGCDMSFVVSKEVLGSRGKDATELGSGEMPAAIQKRILTRSRVEKA